VVSNYRYLLGAGSSVCLSSFATRMGESGSTTDFLGSANPLHMWCWGA
jgi:hypothetical protein